MKICLVGSGVVQIPPRRGGAAERVIQNLAEILSEEHEVTILDFGDEGEILEMDGYDIRRISLGRTQPQWQRIKFGLKSSMEIPGLDPDVVHVHTVFSGLPIALLKPRTLVYTSHNPAWTVENPGVSNSLVNKLESIIFRRADRVTAVSNYQRKCILEKSSADAEKVSVIHNFVEAERMDVKSEEKPMVLFLGKHTRHKGIHIFLKAVDMIRDEMPVRAVSIGPTGRFGEEGKEFWGEADVEFLGAASEEEKFEMLNKADVILCPTDREGHSLVHLEAQASGLPVVATDIPPSKESIDENRTGLLAERTPEDFAEKAIRIIEEDWKNAHAGDFTDWMKRFSKDRIGKKWREFYRSLRPNTLYRRNLNE